MFGLDETVKEFLIESHENLDRLDRDLIVLEREPRHRESLASIFRTIHTIKGTCGFFDFKQLGSLTHAGENLLSPLRDGKRLLDAETTGVLLALVDAVRLILGTIERTGNEGTDDFSRLTARIAAAAKGEPAKLSECLPEPPALDGFPESGPSLSDGTIRVDVALLDRLMNLVGELVLARNQIVQFTSSHQDGAFVNTTQRLNTITTELQESVMKTRMQPIATVWNKFPRICRDLAITCGRKIHLTMDGKETELDKSIIEAIKDPLTHLLRNAIDHGIESPEIRRQLGKPVEGHLHLRAFHEGGQVNIEVNDDGAGMDPQRIRQKAIERGLIARDRAALLNDREALQLIFLPGFSTAATVTNVSGRGVGMDVVKTNIEKISGTVDVVSKVGQGTTVKLKIPLTLAIIPTLLVTCDGDRYAIPQVNLLELLRIEAENVPLQIEEIHGARVHRLRGSLLPLVYLRGVLGLGLPIADGEAVNIVVLQADDRPFGLVVDAINDTEEIVVKPLGKQLKAISLYAGATILGDGRVALILDALGVAQNANIVGENREHPSGERLPAAETAATPHQTLLLVGAGRLRRFAIPLTQVARLEEIPLDAVEVTAGGEVAQYRDSILPLLRLSRLLGIDDAAGETEGGKLPVVVCSGPGQSIGLVVDRIIDIVETPVELQSRGREIPGLRGTCVIRGRVTEILDPAVLLAHALVSPVEV